jgi:hypothetical protein
MTIEERILECLKIHPEGVDDDNLAEILNLSARQQANIRCRDLQKRGIVSRRKVDGKIRNFLTGSPAPERMHIKTQPKPETEKTKRWSWEGNVQAQIIRYLSSHGYLIRSFADTASHETGVDIIAEIDGKPLWVTVKGYPLGTERTRASAQAVHWFSSAMFDILRYRGEVKETALALGLPDYPRYRALAAKIVWVKSVAIYEYYWVNENGQVTIE